jgi:hypothetical protein
VEIIQAGEDDVLGEIGGDGGGADGTTASGPQVPQGGNGRGIGRG